MRPVFFAMAVLMAGGAAVRPAEAQRAPSTNPIAAAVRGAWDGAKRNLTESAVLMPESDYAFRPVDSVRTFGQILAHVAGANYVFCAAAKGEKTPFAEDAFEKTATTRQQIIKAVNDSVAYCDAAYAALDDNRAREISRLMVNTGHVQEHYGNLVTYFRIKGIVPPSSRR